MDADLQEIIEDCKRRNKELRKLNRQMKRNMRKRAIKDFFRKIFY